MAEELSVHSFEYPTPGAVTIVNTIKQRVVVWDPEDGRSG